MKNHRVFNRVVFLLIILSAVFNGKIYAKYYSIPEVAINCRLESDGTMHISEERTYSFSGSFSYAFRIFPKDSRVEFTDFKVSEGSSPYLLSSGKKPGTYMIIRRNSGTEVRWFYSASNEMRTFVISYTVKNDVKRYNDTAVLYFKFISDTWDRKTDRAMIVIEPPEVVTPEKVKHWMHGPLNAVSEITDTGTILGRCSNLPAYTYLEFRILYPPELFKDIPVINKSVADSITDEEAVWSQKSNERRIMMLKELKEQRKRMKHGLWAVILISVLGLGYWWNSFNKYGRRHKISGIPEVASEIPEGINPALASYLLYSRQISGTALTATLFDCAKKGMLKLEEVEGRNRAFGRKSGKDVEWVLNRKKFNELSSGLKDYETELILFIFDTIGAGSDRVSLKTISKSRSKFMKFFRKWRKLVKKEGEAMGWFDMQSIKAGYKSMAVSGILLVLLFPAAFYCGICSLVLGGSSMTVFILSLFIMHRTREGEEITKKLLAVRKYLMKYHFRENAPDRLYNEIESFIVYGIVFGMTKKHYREMINIVHSESFPTYVPWYVMSSHSNPADIANSFSHVVAVTTTVMSSSTGAGGGASAGGGGGASAGGGGAG
ncbi:DUF2207 domain-containing protein [bacterium]|nr:DUF2207 domain-containing protein [bacterium]